MAAAVAYMLTSIRDRSTVRWSDLFARMKARAELAETECGELREENARLRRHIDWLERENDRLRPRKRDD